MKKSAAILLTAILAAAQQGAPPQQGEPAAAQPGVAKFSTSLNLVVETVTVNDKNGKPIDGLKATDFTITENGAPQKIAFCEFQRLPEPGEGTANFSTRPEAAPPKPAAPKPATPPAPPVTTTQIQPEAPGDLRYRDKRLLTLYFDMSAMQVPDQLRAFTATLKFLKTQTTPADLIAIMQFTNGAVKVLQDFTSDRDQLLLVLNNMITASEGLDENADDASSSDTGSAFGQDDGEFNIFNTDRQLSALQTAVKMLGTLNEKKALIYFASGLRLNGVDNQAQLRATLNAAIRANVVMYPIDARGLVASAPLGDATQGSQGGGAMYTGGAAMAMMNGFQKSQDTLYALAADTGGKAMFDYNDLSMGIVQAQKALSSYYVLGYYTSNTTPDGRYRRINISLKEFPSAKLDYRQGYFGPKEFSKFTQADKERQLEDALMLGDPITDLTIVMEVNYFQLNRAEYYVPVVMKIPGSELALARKGGAERTVIDFIGEIKDEYNTTIQNIRDKVDIKLSGETAAELQKRQIQYDTGYTLLPGKYTIKVLARDAETGRIGTFMNTFVIPNLNKVTARIPISSVVLSSQRVPLSDALYTAGKDKDQITNPLVNNGEKLVPSVTRVFSKNRDMYVYLQAYEPAAESIEPLVAYVTFYRGASKAFETPPLPVTEGIANRLKTVPLKFSIALNNLPPGRYNCQVTVLDAKSQKAAFWQAPVMLVP